LGQLGGGAGRSRAFTQAESGLADQPGPRALPHLETARRMP
jgi:hypothetical protein